MLPAPGFHHLHLNSVDPDAAIEFYVRQFPASAICAFVKPGVRPALGQVSLLTNTDPPSSEV